MRSGVMFLLVAQVNLHVLENTDLRLREGQRCHAWCHPLNIGYMHTYTVKRMRQDSQHTLALGC